MALFLVTGGAGFIGSNIVEELLRRNEGVRVLDNFSTGRRENIAPFMDKIELIEGDIRDYHTVERAVDGVDFVLHQAALPSVPRSIADPITTNDVNVGGTLNILEASRKARVKRVVYASSAAVYGDNTSLPLRESYLPKPISPYAVSKLAGEYYCQSFWKTYNLSTVSLRYFNVYGPRSSNDSDYSGVVSRFMMSAYSGVAPTIFGNGKQTRDFVYVGDVVSAILSFCFIDGIDGYVFNVASGKVVSVLNLWRTISDTYELSNIEPIFEPTRVGDIKDSAADISHIQKVMDYVPLFSLNDGIKKTLEWFSCIETKK